MIDIIKNGIKPEYREIIYTTTCPNCHCEFEFEYDKRIVNEGE